MACAGLASSIITLKTLITRPADRVVLLTLMVVACAGFGTQSRVKSVGEKTSPQNDSNSVSFIVTVTDKAGAYVTKLDKSAFSVSDNRNLRHEITYFSDEEQALSLGIVLDISSSAGLVDGQNNKLERELKAELVKGLTEFISPTQKNNEYFLAAFAGRSKVLVDWTSDWSPVLDASRKIEYDGPTALYDGCRDAIKKVSTGTNSKHVLVIVSDGLDNRSQSSFNELLDLVRSSDVLIYSIVPPFKDLTSLGEGSDQMQKLASVSGGKFFSPATLAGIPVVFRIITTELKDQYLLRIKPTPQRGENKWHGIKVRVSFPAGVPKRPEFIVRSRTGYFAP